MHLIGRAPIGRHCAEPDPTSSPCGRAEILLKKSNTDPGTKLDLKKQNKQKKEWEKYIFLIIKTFKNKKA